MAASASVSLAVNFILVISSSSPLATASVSYFWRQHWDSASALATSLRQFSRPAASSSRAQRAPSSSCSRFLYLPRSRPLSRASLSHRALTSLSWAARAAFCLAKMLRLLSRSPTMRRRSEFSQEILFLLEAKSPRVRLASSTFLLMALLRWQRCRVHSLSLAPTTTIITKTFLLIGINHPRSTPETAPSFLASTRIVKRLVSSPASSKEKPVANLVFSVLICRNYLENNKKFQCLPNKEIQKIVCFSAEVSAVIVPICFGTNRVLCTAGGRYVIHCYYNQNRTNQFPLF